MPLVAFIRESAGSSDPKEVKAWLRENTRLVVKKSAQLEADRFERTMKKIDRTVGVRVYQSDRTPDEWRDFLTAHDEFEEEPNYDPEQSMEGLYGPVLGHFHWMRLKGSLNAPRTAVVAVRVSGDGEHVDVLGSLFVHEGHLVLTGIGRELFAWLETRWTSVIAPGLVLENEGAQQLSFGSQRAASDAPTQDEEFHFDHPDKLKVFAAFEDRHLRSLIDEPIPVLGDRTPRELAGSEDPQDRATLERWAKIMLHGEYQRCQELGHSPETA